MMTEEGEAAAAAETSEVIPETDTNEGELSIDFSDAPEKLAAGLLSTYQEPLEHVQKELKDITTKQEVCIDQMQKENKKMSEVLEDAELSELFSNVETYQRKLKAVRKEIMSIHERTFKLKKRAQRLQQIKQKEALTREHQHEQELQREEQQREEQQREEQLTSKPKDSS